MTTSEVINNNDVEINSLEWAKMRSEIYIRDKGICWVCNDFTELVDYDLGHLIDRSHNGHFDYDNLAVMHKACNLRKPRHDTLEEAMKWKLTPSYLNHPKPKVLPLPEPIQNQALVNLPSFKTNRTNDRSLYRYDKKDVLAIQELVTEYFTSHPELLENSSGYNKDRLIASNELAKSLNITTNDIRDCLRSAGLVNKRPPQVTDGSQYRFVAEHLNELLEKYEIAKTKFLYAQPGIMGISHFCMDIMFFLSGQFDKVSKRNFPSIQKRVKQLGLPIVHNPANKTV